MCNELKYKKDYTITIEPDTIKEKLSDNKIFITQILATIIGTIVAGYFIIRKLTKN